MLKQLHIGLQSNHPELLKDDNVIINLHMRRLKRLEKYTDFSKLNKCIMNVSDLGFKDNAFEGVFAGKVLHWIDNKEGICSAIKEMIRVAKHKVDFTVLNYGADMELREKYGLCFSWSTWKSHPEVVQQYFTPDNLTKLLEELNIKNYKVSLHQEILDTDNGHIIKATREYTVQFDEETMEKPFIKFKFPLHQIIQVIIEK